MVVMQTFATGDFVAGEKLGVVKFGELAAIIRGDKLLKFVKGLNAQCAAVHEKENAARSGEFDEAIDKVTGSKGFAAAGCHLDEGTGAAGSERIFQVQNS